MSPARSLGARGSRAAVGPDDPAQTAGEAARAVLAGASGWWERAARAAGLSGRWLQLEEAIDGLTPPPLVAEPPDLGRISGFSLGARYVAALPPGVRSRHGRHYTPPMLAQRLWAMARFACGQRRVDQPLPGLVWDPACGAGALLLPPLHQHLNAHKGQDPEAALEDLPRLIQGTDTDPSAVWLANAVLAAQLLPVLARIPEARRRPLPKLARVGDGLSSQPASVRVAVMNPPYGRVRLSEEERIRWGRYLYGHANLYSLFLAAGLESLDDEGVLAALVPTSFLAGRYFASLRDELTRQAPLRGMTFVEERDGVFTGVLQETCLATFTRRRARRLSIASANGKISSVAQVAPPRGKGPWVLPRHPEDARAAAAAKRMPLTLGSAGWRVSTGPLVWNRRRADLGDEPSKGAVRVLWAADLDGGSLHFDPSRKRLRWFSTKEIDSPAMVLREPAVLVQRTTAPEQQRRLVCVELTPELLRKWGGCVTVENHVNVVRPATEGPPLLSRSLLAAVLSTRTVDRVMRCISGSVAVSAYELESLPLPDEKTLEAWESLRGDELEKRVARNYSLAT